VSVAGIPGARTTSGGTGQRAYLRGPGEAGNTGWWRRLVLCGGWWQLQGGGGSAEKCRGRGTRDTGYGRRRPSLAATGRAAAAWSQLAGQGRGGRRRELAVAGEKGKGVQGWSMWMSRPLGHALHSLSLFFGKRFLGVSIGRSFPFGFARPTDETLPFVPRALRRHFLAPRRRETHVLFFPRKVLSGFAAPFFLLPFARRVFGRRVRADCFSFRRVWPICRGGAGARDVVAALK
jgi:hypothetical protein